MKQNSDETRRSARPSYMNPSDFLDEERLLRGRKRTCDRKTSLERHDVLLSYRAAILGSSLSFDNVRCGSKADIAEPDRDVRFVP